MSDLGDIGGILDEKPLANLDWLDVDKDEYRATERLPKQNLDAIPELEAQWKDLTEADQYRLSPENREFGTSPFWSERPAPGALSESDARDIVEKFARKHVQAGVTAPDLIEILKRSFDQSVLKTSTERIREVLAERGLLGSVYIDAELFSDCYKGSPEGLTPNNKTAKFVIAKSKCDDCIHNQNGRCGVFKKEIVMEVDYTKDLWEEYKEDHKHERKDLSASQNLSYKTRIQRAILASPASGFQALDGKPVVADPTKGVDYGEAMEALRSADIRQEIVANTVNDKKVRRIAYEMMRGNHNNTIRDLLASDPALESLRDELHLLGKLYSRLDFFDTKRQAAEFFRNTDNRPPLTFGAPKEETFDARVAHSRDVDFSDKRVVAQVAKRLIQVRTGSFTKRQAGMYRTLCAKMLQAGAAKTRQLAVEAFSSLLPAERRVYEGTDIFDPTRGISAREADHQLAQVETKQIKADSPARSEVIARMLCGDHGNRTASLIENEAGQLKGHLHLLGNLYVDTRLASRRDIQSAAKRNPTISELPLLTPNNRDGFFMKPEVHARIADRIASHKGLEGEERIRSMRQMVRVMEESTEKKVVSLAKKAFSTPINVPVVSSETAASGHTDMQEFELGPVARDGDLSDIELSGDRQGILDVQFGDGLTLE